MARTPRNSCVHVRPAYKVLVAVGVCWLWIMRRADRQSSAHFFTFPRRIRPVSLEFTKIDATTCSIAPEQSDFVRYSSLKASDLTSRSADRYDCAGRCSVTSTCFLGYCSCHPGYGGTWCTETKITANPWYTADCPNLRRSDGVTLDINTPLSEAGGGNCHVGSESSLNTKLSYCAHLCYSSEVSGVPIVPVSIWQAAQQAEGELWATLKKQNGDRYEDHWEGFQDYEAFKPNADLGSVIEFGSGPWTQFRGVLHKRPDLKTQKYTVVEPGASYYMNTVPTCAYRTGELRKLGSKEFFQFPIEVISTPGESRLHTGAYDTVISINVIEHVQNAIEYFHSLHAALRPGGILIFHERFYPNPPAGDAVLGENIYHPIRLTQLMFDVFLSDFDILFNNCDGHHLIKGWLARDANERGYYVIAKKRS